MIYQLDTSKPEIHETAWIAPSADVIGNVVLCPNASVWFQAVLRGDTDRIKIGEGSNIQDGCICHVDPGFPLQVGKNVTVGHKAMLHGCTIDDDALIGMGATVLNGAHIGKGAVIGAGALVPEGKQIPDGALVMGVPGKIVRQLSTEERANFRKGAARYVERAARYRLDLQKLDD